MVLVLPHCQSHRPRLVLLGEVGEVGVGLQLDDEAPQLELVDPQLDLVGWHHMRRVVTQQVHGLAVASSVHRGSEDATLEQATPEQATLQQVTLGQPCMGRQVMRLYPATTHPPVYLG